MVKIELIGVELYDDDDDVVDNPIVMHVDDGYKLTNEFKSFVNFLNKVTSHSNNTCNDMCCLEDDMCCLEDKGILNEIEVVSEIFNLLDMIKDECECIDECMETDLQEQYEILSKKWVYDFESNNGMK